MAGGVEYSAGRSDAACDWRTAVSIMARPPAADFWRTTEVSFDAHVGHYGVGAGCADLCGVGTVCHAQYRELV